MSAVAASPQSDQLSRRAWGALFVLCGALFLDALDVSMIGCILLSWLRLIALDGDLARAEPKTLRYLL